MIKFQSSTIYAMRIIGYLRLENGAEPIHAAEMSEELGVSYLYLMKILNMLRAAEIICSVQGRNGGYWLEKSAADIMVYDVVRVFEGEIDLYHPTCANPDREIEDNIEDFMCHLQNSMLDLLKNSSVKDIFDKRIKFMVH